MKKDLKTYEGGANVPESGCSKPECQQFKHREQPSHSGSIHRHVRSDKWRSNRRAIFLFGLFSSVMAFLVIGGVLILVWQAVQWPMMDHHSMMDVDPRRFVPFFIFLLIMGALFVTGRFSRKRFTNPLEKILNAADDIAEGDLTTRIEGIGYGPFARVETAFNNMVEALERSDQVRRDQTADIAHELNTPIHIIRGYLEGISDGIYKPDEEMIVLLLEETSLLSRLVEDLRLLSLADAGRLPMHPEAVNLKAVLEDIQVSFMGQAAEQGIKFSIDVNEDAMIHADSSHIYRIINNLVANALSYTERGGAVILSVKNSNGQERLSIADTGQGMTPEDLAHAFDRFWRKDKSRQRKDGGGYGLGLSIVQQLVIANGGQITVESAVGEGTRFTIQFPQQGQ